MKSRDFLDLHVAKHRVFLWIIALLITLSSAVYQRLTGPTYPMKGELSIGTSTVNYKLLRSENVGTEAPIVIQAPDTAVSGYVRFKRYKSYDRWRTVPLRRKGDNLVASLPSQPAAGKLIYSVIVKKGGIEVSVTKDQPVILRYKGGVPAAVLLPHIIFMFLAMLFSNRTGLEALDSRGKAKKHMLWTIGFFFIGGFILGPIVQKYAFGSLWEGIPFGTDLTDNKTLIGMLGWLVAWYKNRKELRSRGWIILASILLLAVYLVPHSMLGSEIDYRELENGSGK